jgi:putative membrane protein
MNAKAKFPSKMLYPALESLSLLAWGSLLLKYFLSGQLRLLIHPNYFGLVFATSIVLLIIGGIKAWQLFKQWRKRNKLAQPEETVKHITLLPAGAGSSLLLITALLGWMIAPTPLTSQIALQRGFSESYSVTRIQPQAFRASIKPEERSLVDWVRTLNVYPEPDAYTGQKVKVSGFVVHLPELPENYLFVSRFILTCCAVDAYPVGLPVKLSQNRSLYPPDTWLEIEGEMLTDDLAIDSQQMKQTSLSQRQLVINARSVQKIPTPADPYGY